MQSACSIRSEWQHKNAYEELPIRTDGVSSFLLLLEYLARETKLPKGLEELVELLVLFDTNVL